jgi:hypothetical protein
MKSGKHCKELITKENLNKVVLWDQVVGRSNRLAPTRIQHPRFQDVPPVGASILSKHFVHARCLQRSFARAAASDAAVVVSAVTGAHGSAFAID